MTRINAMSAAKLLGVSRQKLYQWRRAGDLPPTVSDPKEPLEWNEDELRHWFQNRRWGDKSGSHGEPRRRPAEDRLKKIEARVKENREAVGGLVSALVGVTASIQEIDGKAASLIAQLDANLKTTKDALTAASRKRSEQGVGQGEATSILPERIRMLEASNQELRSACAVVLGFLKVVGQIMSQSRAGDSEQFRRPLSAVTRLSQEFAGI